MALWHTSTIVPDSKTTISVNLVSESKYGRTVPTVELTEGGYGPGFTFHCADDASARELGVAFRRTVLAFERREKGEE